MRTIQEELEKKLAGQNKLSRRDEGLYDAMKGQFVLQHSTVTGLYSLHTRVSSNERAMLFVQILIPFDVEMDQLFHPSLPVWYIF